MKVCPNCSTEFEDQLNFCRLDGTALKLKQAGRACPGCGGEVGNDSKFCRHCGASLESPKASKADERAETLAQPESTKKEVETAEQSPFQRAENYLKEGNYREATSILEAIVKANPKHQEARLLHLYATVKLYNVYGYEKQIESLRALSDLSEKEREIVREVFLIRSEEAQKRGRTAEAREYQRLATRVILGQPLIEAVPEPPVLPTQPKPQEAASPKISPQVERQPQSGTRPTAPKVDASSAHVRNLPRKSEKSSRLLVSFLIVFGLAGLLAAGMLAHYAKKQGVNVSDIFTPKPPATPQPEVKPPSQETTPSGQVVAVEELGFKVWGAGATDANRRESVISEQIGAQLSDLRRLYQQEVQSKPDLMGSIILQLTISPTGAVTKVEEYAARIRDTEFKKAVVNEIYKWSFLEANAGLVKVNYPLLFVPPKIDVATARQWERNAGPPEPVQVAKAPNPKDAVDRPAESVPGKQRDLQPPNTEPDGPKKPVNPEIASAPKPPPPVVPTEPSRPFVDKPIIGQYEVIYPTSVFREPKEDSTQLARIEAGTIVNVVEARGQWLEVRSKQGRPPGFIKKDSATPLKNR